MQYFEANYLVISILCQFFKKLKPGVAFKYVLGVIVYLSWFPYTGRLAFLLMLGFMVVCNYPAVGPILFVLSLLIIVLPFIITTTMKERRHNMRLG